MSLKEEMDNKINQHLHDFSLACSENNLREIEKNLLAHTLFKSQEVINKIELSYTRLSSLFTSSNYNYANNFSPELMSINDIRYCIPINKTYISHLNNLIATTVKASTGFQIRTSNDITISLVTFLKIINSILIIFYNIIKNENILMPTGEEIESYILRLLEIEKEQACVNLPPKEKESLLEKYLINSQELDSYLE